MQIICLKKNNTNSTTLKFLDIYVYCIHYRYATQIIKHHKKDDIGLTIEFLIFEYSEILYIKE